MSDTSRLETLSEAAAGRHQRMIASMISASKGYMSGQLAFSRVRAGHLKEELQELGAGYLDSFSMIMWDDLTELSQSGRDRALSDLSVEMSEELSTALSERLSASVDAIDEFTSGEMISQINRDASQVLKSYRDASLRVVMVQDSEGVSAEDARMSVMIDEMSQNRRLWFVDRAGRKIPSQKHIRRLYRKSLRQASIDAYLQTLAYWGEVEAIVWHPDPNHSDDGKVMVIGEVDYGLEDYDQIFHPNSRALPMAASTYETLYDTATA